jgi:hypothetical protein
MINLKVNKLIILELKQPNIVKNHLINVVNLASVSGVLIDRFLQNNLSSNNIFFFGKETFEEKFLSIDIFSDKFVLIGIIFLNSLLIEWKLITFKFCNNILF